MKKLLRTISLTALTLCSVKNNAQVSVYAFNQLSGTYNAIIPGSPSSTIIAQGSQDDNSYASFPIGFNFFYNGSNYTTFGLNVNGWISLGSTTPLSSYNPISSGSTNNIISGFSRDLQLGPYQSCNVTSGSNVITFTYPAAANFFNVGDTISGTGIPVNASVTAISAPNMTISSPATSAGTSIYTKGRITYALTGVSPNQVLTVQWSNCGRWSASSTGLDDYMNFQIKLYETTNIVEIIYGNTGTNNTGTATMEVGLRGNSTADYNNRSVLSGGSWAASTAGAVNSASGFFSSTTAPSSGQIYRWSPPAGCTGTPASNSVVSSSSVVCTGGTANLSLATTYTNSGYTYQWFASPTGSAGSYTTIAGATSSTYAAVVSANSFYQAVITCTNGPASVTATPVQVNVGGNGCQCNSYCASNATSTNDEEIFNVTIGTLNNTSTCGQTGGPGSIMNEYSNYTGMFAAPSLTAGSTYSISLTAGECSGFSYSAMMAAYIDYNQNGSFTDPGEAVYTSTYGAIAVSGTTFTANITIPASASIGITRMRVVLVESSVVTPCGTYSWGETEDYCVNIQAAAACSGAPGANSAVASMTTVCPNGSVTVSLANSYTVGGLTYQWSTATSSVGPYTSVPNATLSSYTASNLSANTWFQAVITCTNGMVSTTATPVQVLSSGNPCQCTTYCNSNATSTADDEIFNVTLGSLNNTSTCGQTGGSGSLLNEYSNYSGIVAAPTVSTGTTYTMGVTVGQCNGFAYSGGVVVYMDFNQNGVFTDAGEMVYASQMTTFSITGTPLTFNISVPLTASVGITRMRVIAAESILSQPSCGTFSWGETEDYCINIVPLPPCTTASGGFITNATYTACGSQTLALTSNSVSTGTGTSYQWMVSSTPGGSYTAVSGGSGATTPSYTTAALSPTVYYYVLQTTCASASLTAVSNEATVSVNPVPTAFASTVAPVCAGQNIPLTSTTNIGTNFMWVGPNSFTSTSQNPTINNAPATAQGNYTLTVSANNCTSTPVTVSVTVKSTNLNIAGSSTICLGNSTTLTAVGNATTLTWSNGSTGSSIVVAPTTNTVYSVTGTGTSNCVANSSVAITVSNPTITGTGTSVCVPGATGTLTANAFGPISWYATSTPTNAIGTGNTFTTNAVNTTTYYAQAVSSSSGTLFTTLAAGNGFSGNMFDVVAINSIDVNGFDMHFSSTGTATVEVWYRSGSFVGFESSNAGWTMAYTTTATALGTGVITPIPGSFTVNVPAGQTYGFYVTALSSGPQVNYTNGTTLGSIYVQNSDAKILEGKGGGYFTVTNSPRVFNGQMKYSKQGCTSPIIPVVFNVSTQASITASATTGTVCAGGSTALMASGATTYTWDNGATGAAIAVTPSVSTTYTVTGDNGGCTGTATVAVAVNPLPTVNVTSAQGTVCVNGPTVALTGSPAGGVYTGSNVAGNVFTPGANAGTFTPGYNVTSTVTGCSNTAYTTIIVSTCTGIDKLISSANELMIYPNPNTGIFTIELKNSETTLIELSDLTGRIILSEKTSQNKLNINISNFANGIYLVKVQSNNRTEMIKVIKE